MERMTQLRDLRIDVVWGDAVLNVRTTEQGWETLGESVRERSEPRGASLQELCRLHLDMAARSSGKQ